MEDYAGTMKTNASARYLAKIRVIMVCAALAALVGLEYSVSESLAARFGQYTAAPTQAPQAPSLSLGDMMAAAR